MAGYYELLWLPSIVDKIHRKHQIHLSEVEELMFSNPKIRWVEKGHLRGEDMYVASGQTAVGRYILVYFVLKLDGRALIVSARDMDDNERRYYSRK